MREDVIRRYFDAWVKKEADALKDIFAEDVIYTESYGPEYHGLGQVASWFEDWNRRGSVLKWDIFQILSCSGQFVVEWNFECKYDDWTENFDGVSLITFTPDDKIQTVKEFQSKSSHTYPYGR